jgi:hypothetical protein
MSHRWYLQSWISWKGSKLSKFYKINYLVILSDFYNATINLWGEILCHRHFKENADILATTVADIINTSYNESRLPSSWKFANIIPIPKAKPVREVNKDLRQISLTPILSKFAEDLFVKPAVLKKIDPNQYGTVPRYYSSL